MRVTRVEHGLDGVERAGADVSEDDPESPDRERPLGGVCLNVALHPGDAGVQQRRPAAANPVCAGQSGVRYSVT